MQFIWIVPVKNVPDGLVTWGKMQCPTCGEVCWESKKLLTYFQAEYPHAQVACTECVRRAEQLGK